MAEGATRLPHWRRNSARLRNMPAFTTGIILTTEIVGWPRPGGANSGFRSRHAAASTLLLHLQPLWTGAPGLRRRRHLYRSSRTIQRECQTAGAKQPAVERVFRPACCVYILTTEINHGMFSLGLTNLRRSKFCRLSPARPEYARAIFVA